MTTKQMYDMTVYVKIILSMIILYVFTRDLEDITQQNLYIVQSRSLFVEDCQQNLVILTHGQLPLQNHTDSSSHVLLPTATEG
jgi:hypothetical protein